MDQYNTNAVTKCWVVLDYADLETVATMVDDEDPSRVLSYINAKVLKHTAEVSNACSCIKFNRIYITPC